MKQFLEKIRRILKPGGTAVITLPSLQDSRCKGHAADAEGFVSFAFAEGAEKGIVHTFCSEEAVRSVFAAFEVLKLEEIPEEKYGDAHWHLLVRK